MRTTAFQSVRLADCVDLLAGFAFKSERFTEKTEDIPLVKGENVSQGRILWEISRRWPAADWPNLQKYQLRARDVIVAMDRPWVPAGLKWAYIRGNDPRALLVQRCSRLRSNTPSLDQDFLRFVIGGPGFESYVKPITTGVNVPHISGRQILDYTFSLPPISIQKRIAGILSAYDDLIENSQRRIKILEEMARALYREWFVHFRFPGHEHHPRVPSPLGEIPKGWEIKSLAGLMDMRGGSQPEKSEFVYEEQAGYVRLIQIRDFESDSHLTFVSESPKLRLCKRSDIMIARYGASVARVCSGLDGAYNVALVKVVPLVPNCQEFLREFLSDDDFQKRLIGMSGRAAQNGFNKSDIASIQVPVPRDPTLLERFERFAVPNRNAIQNLNDQIKNLRRTRDLLLPRLLSGQIDVEAIALWP